MFIPYPDAERVVMDLLDGIAPTVTSLPHKFDTPVIVVQRVGGAPDADDITDYPLVLVSCYGADRPAAWALAAEAQVAVLSSPGQGDGFCVDEAEVATGDQQIPDLDPDDRRVTSVYRLGWRRQYHLVQA